MNNVNWNELFKEQAENLTSDEILAKYGITEYTTSDLVRELQDAMAFKTEQARVFKILDAADHSEVWKVFNRKIPSYVQTPVNNLITVIKEATKASTMPTSYNGEFRAMSLAAKDVAERANRFFKMKWETCNIDKTNNEAADYTFLHGTSAVLFGWNDNIIDGSDVTNYFNPSKHANFQSKAIHPSNLFPDPSAATVDELRYVFIAERKSKDFLKSIPRFQAALGVIENTADTVGNLNDNYVLDKNKQTNTDIVSFITCYKKVLRAKPNAVTGQIQLVPSVDIIYMAGKNILDISKDIQPNTIPMVMLYDETIPNNFWGISKCYKVLSLQLTLNQLDSTEATAYFRNQNPAEFINALSGLNVAEYQRKRGNPNAAFPVNCDPRVVQSYAEIPDIPKNLDTFRQYLLHCIEEISGVDAAYLGQGYGSIQTTGGVEQAIDRSTMRDNNRIKQIDTFIREELMLMIQFYIVHGQRERFYAEQSLTRQEEGQEYEFDPMELLTREDIMVTVTNSVPRSNSSYEKAAMQIMELQMKYMPQQNGYPDFITPEEFISFLNIPRDQKQILIDRMRVQQENMKLEEYTAVVSALGQLTQGGMPPEEALMQIVQQVVGSPVGATPAARANNMGTNQQK